MDVHRKCFAWQPGIFHKESIFDSRDFHVFSYKNLFFSLCPSQVSEFDAYGNLPLHIAALAYQEHVVLSSKKFEDGSTISAAAASDEQSLTGFSSHDNSRNWDTASLYSEATTAGMSTVAGFSQRKSAWDQVFDILLQKYPDGACTPQKVSQEQETGQVLDTVPLVLAMKAYDRSKMMSWQNDGLERLMHAYPPALHLVLETAEIQYSEKSTTLHYSSLLSLLLTPDWMGQESRRAKMRTRTRSVRMDPTSTLRTPLDVARMSAVYALIKTKPEIIPSFSS